MAVVLNLKEDLPEYEQSEIVRWYMKTKAGGKAALRFIFNIKPIAGLCAVVLWLSRYVKVTVDSASSLAHPVSFVCSLEMPSWANIHPVISIVDRFFA